MGGGLLMMYTSACPECGLTLGDLSLLAESSVVCPGCGTIVPTDTPLSSDALVKADPPPSSSHVVRGCLAADALIPWCVGALATFVLVVVLSKILSSAFELNVFGVLAACASSFLALIGEGATESGHPEEA